MSNKKGLFGIINSGSGDGLGITKAVPGTTAGSAIAVTMATPCFVNSSGVLVFPQLDAQGRIRVTSDAAGSCYSGEGKVVGSTSFQVVADFTVALTKKYDKIGFLVSSMTECDWELVYINDAGGTPIETILAYADTGPGQYTFGLDSMSCVEVDTTGATAVQKFVIRGKLLEATGAEIAATLWFHEITE